MTCNANRFIEFYLYFDRGLDRSILNLLITNGQIENIIKSFIADLHIQKNIGGFKEQKMNLDVRIRCDISEESEK